MLYLMTMGILAVRLFSYLSKCTPIHYLKKPYRSRKLGSKCLELILAAAEAHTKPEVDKIYLHVQVSNEQAKNFYTSHGFEQVGIQQDYYKKIIPHDAWVLEMVLRRDKTKELSHN
jgi:ribosomal protein S18 acetylase RimI-like enzyme